MNKLGRPPIDESGMSPLITSQPNALIDKIETIAKCESSDKSKVCRIALNQYVDKWAGDNPGIIK